MEQNFINENQSQEEPQQNPPYIPNTDSSTSDSTYNSTQNITCPEQPYYLSQSTDKVQQYPAQSYPAQPYPAQPYPAQNMVIPPNQPYYPPQESNPIQPGVPMNNYPLQPTTLNVQNIPPNQYYKPYSLVQHKGILQTENNTFYITEGSTEKCVPFIPLFVSLFFILFGILKESFAALILALVCIIFSIIAFFSHIHSIFIVLGPNALTVIKKALCHKKTIIYNTGDLERINFTETKVKGKTIGKKGNYDGYKYEFTVVSKSGNVDLIYNKFASSEIFTSDEIEYFLYTVNTHIQKTTRYQNK